MESLVLDGRLPSHHQNKGLGDGTGVSNMDEMAAAVDKICLPPPEQFQRGVQLLLGSWRLEHRVG